MKVVYLCIICYSMHSIFALPGWRYECMLIKKGVSHFRLFLVFVRLPIYCVYTYFLNKISSFLSFFTFSLALLLSIPSPKYQSKMTNPLFSQYAFVTSSR